MIYLEYIWLDNKDNYRSKIKIIEEDKTLQCALDYTNINNIPEWNYDGSSTGQAEIEHSEVKLIPVKVYRHRDNQLFPYLVLCETHNTAKDTRCHHNAAKEIFDKYSDHQPMFGLEQEFFMLDTKTVPSNIPEINLKCSGEYYCGNGRGSARTRDFLLEVMYLCDYLNIKLTGMNYEVAPGQAEFQVCNIGLDACYDLLILRYLLVRVGEKYHIEINLEPKPFDNENGSGCHINFSTQEMRNENNRKQLSLMVSKMCKNLEKTHNTFINEYYGNGNKNRLSGTCETSSYESFSVKKASRSVSIRIPSIGNYFEDRRPASNINPYLACSKLLECVLN